MQAVRVFGPIQRTHAPTVAARPCLRVSNHVSYCVEARAGRMRPKVDEREQTDVIGSLQDAEVRAPRHGCERFRLDVGAAAAPRQEHRRSREPRDRDDAAAHQASPPARRGCGMGELGFEVRLARHEAGLLERRHTRWGLEVHTAS